MESKTARDFDCLKCKKNLDGTVYGVENGRGNLTCPHCGFRHDVKELTISEDYLANLLNSSAKDADEVVKKLRQVFSSELFSRLIGRTDRILSELILHARNKDKIDEADRQTLKHHAEDMVAAGEKILELLGEDQEGLPQPDWQPNNPTEDEEPRGHGTHCVDSIPKRPSKQELDNAVNRLREYYGTGDNLRTANPRAASDAILSAWELLALMYLDYLDDEEEPIQWLDKNTVAITVPPGYTTEEYLNHLASTRPDFSGLRELGRKAAMQREQAVMDAIAPSKGFSSPNPKPIGPPGVKVLPSFVYEWKHIADIKDARRSLTELRNGFGTNFQRIRDQLGAVIHVLSSLPWVDWEEDVAIKTIQRERPPTVVCTACQAPLIGSVCYLDPEDKSLLVSCRHCKADNPLPPVSPREDNEDRE